MSSSDAKSDFRVLNEKIDGIKKSIKKLKKELNELNGKLFPRKLFPQKIDIEKAHATREILQTYETDVKTYESIRMAMIEPTQWERFNQLNSTIDRLRVKESKLQGEISSSSYTVSNKDEDGNVDAHDNSPKKSLEEVQQQLKLRLAERDRFPTKSTEIELYSNPLGPGS